MRNATLSTLSHYPALLRHVVADADALNAFSILLPKMTVYVKCYPVNASR
jgi:hypothetical protein